jgi:hypothetical protein
VGARRTWRLVPVHKRPKWVGMVLGIRTAELYDGTWVWPAPTAEQWRVLLDRRRVREFTIQQWRLVLETSRTARSPRASSTVERCNLANMHFFRLALQHGLGSNVRDWDRRRRRMRGWLLPDQLGGLCHHGRRQLGRRDQRLALPLHMRSLSGRDAATSAESQPPDERSSAVYSVALRLRHVECVNKAGARARRRGTSHLR